MPNISTPTCKTGFTLIELAIVMVIIGLVVGGIMIGKELIRAAEIRASISQVEQIKTAINTFKVKYNCLPGDCTYATNLFGTDSNGCPAGGGTGTCNGDGNEKISDISYTDNGQEVYRLWQQLGSGYADLIPGKYTGVYTSAAFKFRPNAGVNAPINKLFPNGVMCLYNLDNYAGGSNFFAANYKHILEFWGNSTVITPSVTPSEALSIDTKYDDGMPGYGNIMSYRNTILPNCLTTNSVITAKYDISYAAINCSVFFKMGF